MPATCPLCPPCRRDRVCKNQRCDPRTWYIASNCYSDTCTERDKKTLEVKPGRFWPGAVVQVYNKAARLHSTPTLHACLGPVHLPVMNVMVLDLVDCGEDGRRQIKPSMIQCCQNTTQEYKDQQRDNVHGCQDIIYVRQSEMLGTQDKMYLDSHCAARETP